MKRPEKSTPAFALALFVLMLGCILALAAMGGSLYGSLVENRRSNDARRASLSYVSAQLRAADESGAVSVRKGPEGDALVLAEPLSGSGYETRIYLYNGNLMEEYSEAGSALSPKKAQSIAKTARFSAKIAPAGQMGNLISVTTGEGTVKVYLHSGEAVS